MEEMNIFGSVEHNDDNTDKWPDLCENPTNQDMLNYMALIVARYLECQKAFKGGYMMNQILGSDSRLTHDIDFSIMNAEYYSKVKKVLEQLGDYFVARGLANSYTVKDTITPTSSGGMTVYSEDGSILVGIDVGLHSLLYGTTDYDISIGKVEAFSIERMLSDKILAILSRKRFRRTKDLYDFYVLIHKFDFSYRELLFCIENRDNYDSSVWDNIPFSEVVLEQYNLAWNKLVLVSYADNTILEKPAFNNAIEIFNKIAFRIKNRVDAASWDHVNLNWRI